MLTAVGATVAFADTFDAQGTTFPDPNKWGTPILSFCKMPTAFVTTCPATNRLLPTVSWAANTVPVAASGNQVAWYGLLNLNIPAGNALVQGAWRRVSAGRLAPHSVPKNWLFFRSPIRS